MPPEKYMVNRISMAMGRESMEPFRARKYAPRHVSTMLKHRPAIRIKNVLAKPDSTSELRNTS